MTDGVTKIYRQKSSTKFYNLINQKQNTEISNEINIQIDLYPYDVTFVNKYQSRCIMGLNGGNRRHIVVD